MSPEWVDAICSVVSTLAVLFGAVLAYWGVDNWRRQLKGTTEYQLALKILQSVYKIQDEAKATRSHASLSSESADRPKAEHEDPEKTSLLDQQYVYVQRFTRVLAAERDLFGVELETAAAFGPKINDALKPLHGCVGSLWGAVKTYFPARLADTPPQDLSMKDMMDDLYGTAGPKDEFWNGMEKAVETAEQTFRPHLTEKSLWASVVYFLQHGTLRPPPGSTW